VANAGLAEEDWINLEYNPLSADSFNIYIPQLQARGVEVFYTPGEWDSWVYDANEDGTIEKSEVILAVQHYFDGRITKAQVIEVAMLYFA